MRAFGRDLFDLIVRQVRTDKERFIQRMERNVQYGSVPEGHDTPCVEWTGAVNDTGYPRMNFRDPVHGHVQVKVHHVFYILLSRAPIPEGFDIDHECCNRRCVRHLKAVPAGMNRVWGRWGRGK